jgi:hypothetical protein
MSLELLFDVWSEIVSNRLDAIDKREASEELISYLIDLNYSPSELREYFGNDRDMMKALNEYDKDTEYEELDFDNGDNLDY